MAYGENRLDSVQITRVMLNRQMAASKVALIKANTLPRFRNSMGAQARFKILTRAVNKLPAFGKGLRS
jgi:hypothetical protein